MNTETQKMINDLEPYTDQMTDWESHPHGQNGHKDYGGFFESMQFRQKKDMPVSEAQKEVIRRMHRKYVEGIDSDQRGGGNLLLDHTSAEKEDGGYYVYIGKTRINQQHTKKESFGVAAFVNDNWNEMKEAMHKVIQSDDEESSDETTNDTAEYNLPF